MKRAWSSPGKAALLAAAALAALVLAGGDAWARGSGSGGHGGKSGHSGGKHGGHHSHGSHHHSYGSGSVFFYGGYWAAPVYWLGQYYSPAEPLHYIERSQEEQAESRWYYCESSSAYFPYVLECAGGWVEATPFTVTQ